MGGLKVNRFPREIPLGYHLLRMYRQT